MLTIMMHDSGLIKVKGLWDVYGIVGGTDSRNRSHKMTWWVAHVIGALAPVLPACGLPASGGYASHACIGTTSASSTANL